MTQIDRQKTLHSIIGSKGGYSIKSDVGTGDMLAQIQEQFDMAPLVDFFLRSHAELPEYRCTCGKLLFKGVLFFSSIEIKCKRCGEIRVIHTGDKKTPV